MRLESTAVLLPGTGEKVVLEGSLVKMMLLMLILVQSSEAPQRVLLVMLPRA